MDRTRDYRAITNPTFGFHWKEIFEENRLPKEIRPTKHPKQQSKESQYLRHRSKLSRVVKWRLQTAGGLANNKRLIKTVERRPLPSGMAAQAKGSQISNRKTQSPPH